MLLLLLLICMVIFFKFYEEEKVVINKRALKVFNNLFIRYNEKREFKYIKMYSSRLNISMLFTTLTTCYL